MSPIRQPRRRASVAIELNAVVVAVTKGTPRVLTVVREEADALPSGPLEPERDRTLELGMRRWLQEQTGLEVGYVEQLYTLGNRYRDPRERETGERVLSVAYLTLVREQAVSGESATWRDWYEFFPWEDWREGAPPLLTSHLAPRLEAWVADADDSVARRERRERVELTFGLGGAPWDHERVLDRYEVLYGSDLVWEARRDEARRTGRRSGAEVRTPTPSLVTDDGHAGRAMAADHRRISAIALGRLRGKLRYRPVVFELLPEAFTLSRLQQVVEALSGVRLHTQNFRRLLERGRLVEGTGTTERSTGGRPAELFRFRREVLHERPAPGVGLPTVPIREPRGLS